MILSSTLVYLTCPSVSILVRLFSYYEFLEKVLKAISHIAV